MTIEKVDVNNYSLFEDMVYWRENGIERNPAVPSISEQMKNELNNPKLYIYAALENGRYVGWISLVYIPKVGQRWKGHGHIYIDELWVEPGFRGKGFAKALMKKADDLKSELNATGIRLYVNVNNPTAKILYEHCGFHEDGNTFFMEK